MQQNAQFDYFARLRAEAPVHYCENGMFGPFWSVKFNDIMAMDKNHHDFSCDLGIMTDRPGFYNPLHQHGSTETRCAEAHGAGRVAPMNLAKLESTIRSRAAGSFRFVAGR